MDVGIWMLQVVAGGLLFYGSIAIIGLCVNILFSAINALFGKRLQAKRKKQFYDDLNSLRLDIKIKTETLKEDWDGAPVSSENLEFLSRLVGARSHDPTLHNRAWWKFSFKFGK